MHAPPNPSSERPSSGKPGPNRFPRNINATKDSGSDLALQAETEFTLGVLRLVSVRLGSIRDTINDIGICLKNDRITPGHARALADEAAPHCFEACAEDFQ